ncbi:MAG: hypothetical protein LBU67_01420 [Oscillospiraceae bacterium]|jgi:hypothetical protein|nr:hypothetical protein [Oscillospiraceae bacterium]
MLQNDNVNIKIYIFIPFSLGKGIVPPKKPHGLQQSFPSSKHPLIHKIKKSPTMQGGFNFFKKIRMWVKRNPHKQQSAAILAATRPLRIAPQAGEGPKQGAHYRTPRTMQGLRRAEASRRSR